MPPSPIDLLISDIDGTLVTPDKLLTPASITAVKSLAAAGIAFSVVSSRPPRGMARIVEALGVRLPFAAFNGGSLIGPAQRLITAYRLKAPTADEILKLLARREIDAWVFADDTWRLRDPHGAYVERERRTVGFDPTVVEHFEDLGDRIDKIVGVSTDHARLAAVEVEAQALLGASAIAQRSQLYYLDFTAPEADKGQAVRAICAQVGVAPERTAVIGDMANDVPMFRVAAFSVAMGQAPDAVKAQAKAVTTSNAEEGFARAVEDFILQRSG